jgi:hypothetical protein
MYVGRAIGAREKIPRLENKNVKIFANARLCVHRLGDLANILRFVL